MSRRLDLVGTKEAAAICDVERPRIPRWHAAGHMPPTVAELRMGPLWRRSDVEVLARDGEWKVSATASGKQPKALALMGTAEASARLECDKSSIARWGRAGKFPLPVCVLANGPVWLAVDVEAYAVARETRRAAA